MGFFRRYHRVVRAMLFVVLLFGIVALWRAMVDPRLLDLATYGQLAMTFVLIGAAGILTHVLAKWVAPVAKGQVDEDGDAIVTGWDTHDV